MTVLTDADKNGTGKRKAKGLTKVTSVSQDRTADPIV